MTSSSTTGQESRSEELDEINAKIDAILEMLRSSSGESNKNEAFNSGPLDVMTLLSMPDHLRKTAMVVCRLGRATSEEVAHETMRARALESGYLNQLVTMGHLNKKRDKRKVYFYVPETEDVMR